MAEMENDASTEERPEEHPDWEPEYTTSTGNLMDSRTSHLDDILNQKLEEALHKPTALVSFHDVAKIASEHDPIDLAYAVTRLPPTTRYVVYDNLPDLQSKVIFMINTDSTSRGAIFRSISDQEIKRLIDHMPLDEAVWTLDDMSDRRLRRVLDMLDPKKASRIRDLLKRDRNSAARLMTNEFFAFHMNVTIGEVAAAIRDNPGIELTRSIFVLSDLGQLAGYVPARNLIINPANAPIRQVMRPVLHTIHPETSRDEVVDMVERYKIPALPVIDESNVMIGIVTYEAVVEAMEDIADETIASIAGITEDVSEDTPIFQRALGRSPWLFVTLTVGIITSTAMTYFRDQSWFILVPLFVTLITGMSGNVGLQCSTVLVRGMSTGELSAGTKREAINKELLIGLTIGLVFGTLSGVAVFIINLLKVHPLGLAPLAVGITVGCGVLGACLTATGLGVLFPFFFARLGIDPAIASGPLVTAFNDLSSTLVYFLIAWTLYGLFAI